jgi:hypothetical protein
MKLSTFSSFGILIILIVVPIFIFAQTSIPVTNPFTNPSSQGLIPFGGKIIQVDAQECDCPSEEPDLVGMKKVDYNPFWKKGKKMETSLFYSPDSTKLYKFGKVEAGIWHLGKYSEEIKSCKYMTEEDRAGDGGDGGGGGGLPPPPPDEGNPGGPGTGLPDGPTDPCQIVCPDCPIPAGCGGEKCSGTLNTEGVIIFTGTSNKPTQ